MKEYLTVLAICGVLLLIGVSVVAQNPVRETEVIPHESYVILKQEDYRTIYLKRASISGFAVYPDGFDVQNQPVVVVFMGAKEFRFDVKSADDIPEIVNAFIGESE